VKELAETYKTTAYTDYQKLLPKLDIVTIASPTVTHSEVGLVALDAGVHMLMEKPLAHTIEDGQRLCKKANEKGLKLQVGHIERFNPAVCELDAILAGKRLIAVTARRLSPAPRIVDVDVVLDLMIHDIDIVGHIAKSDPQHVDAIGATTQTDTIDHAMAHLTYSGGVLGQITASRTTSQKIRTLDIVVEGAHIELDYLTRQVVIHRDTTVGATWARDRLQYRQEGIVEKVFVPRAEPLQLEQEAFVKCVLDDEPSPIPGEEGLRAVKLAHLIKERIYSTGLVSSTT